MGKQRFPRLPYFLLTCLALALGLGVALSFPDGSPSLEAVLAFLGRRAANPVVRDLLITLFAFLVLHLVAKRGQEVLLRDLDDITTRHKTRKMVAWAKFLLICLASLLIWGRRVEGLGVFLGMIGAGLTLSVQESLLCIAGWILILTRKPFDLGDRVEISGLTGDVVDIRVFYTSCLEVGGWCEGDQSTGRIIHLPNSHLFRSPTLNYSQGFPFLWDEYSVVITFESDWELAKEILLAWAQEEAEKIEGEVRRHLESSQEKIAIQYRQLRPIVYTAIADHGVQVTLRHLCPIRRRRTSRHEVAEHILRSFGEHPNVELAYPTTRFYRGRSEPEAPPHLAASLGSKDDC